jgi:putative flippase GtrA
MERSSAEVRSALTRARVSGALRRSHNWLQLLKFCVVGASGYVVNLAVFSVLVEHFDAHYLLAATISYLVAVTNNYTWNRLWTFRHKRGHYAQQGMRFLLVSSTALCANLLVLHLLITAGLAEVPAQAIAIVLVTPLNFLGNKLWSFKNA